MVDCHGVTDPDGSTKDASVVEANLLDTCWLQPKVGIHRVAKDMTSIVTTSPHFFAGEEYCVPVLYDLLHKIPLLLVLLRALANLFAVGSVLFL